MSDSDSDVEYNDAEEAPLAEEKNDSDSDVETSVPVRKRKHAASDSEESEDEEEEEESDDDRRHKKKTRKPRKRRPVSDFIYDDVEVDDDEEDDEYEEYDDEGEIGLDPHEREEAERAIIEQQQRYQNKTRFAQMTESQMEEYFKSRHESDNAPVTGMSEEYFDSIAQNGLLPDARSPNLYIVKCRIGEEQELCLRLMRKFFGSLNSAEPLEIKSVVVKDGIKGMFYIEAFKTGHVNKAIDGISEINNYSVKMVPRNEMVDTLRVVRDVPNVKINSYVRVNRTVFNGDLAMIDDYDESRNMVMLKLVPRIDYTKLRGALRNQDTANKGLGTKRKLRPPLALFNPDKVRSIGGELSKDGDFYIFENNRYRNGFLYKYFPVTSINFDGIKPTVGELEMFNESANEFKSDISSGKDFAKFYNFAPGDTIEVIEGELVNLQGKILSIDGDVAYIKPNHEELKDTVYVNLREIRKSFKVGDHALVVEGKYKNDTGIVIRVEENMIILISDINNIEIKVLPRDLRLSPHVATGVDSLGRYQLYDLVQIDKDTFGLITGVHAELLTILSQHGVVLKVKSSQIAQKKETRFAKGTDSNKNTVQKGDRVRLIDMDNKEGEIMQVYRGVAFITCKSYRENGGILVRNCKQLALVGAPAFKAPHAPANDFRVPQSPRHFLGTPKHSSGDSFDSRSNISSTPNYEGGARGGGGGRGFGGGGGGFNKRNNSIVGKHVRIKGGPWKAHYGIIRDATDETAQVELHSKCTIITVNRSRLNIIDGDVAGSRGFAPATGSRTPGSMPGRTPAYGFQTPAYGSATPAHDSFGPRTPRYGTQTPAYGSRTPNHASSWDPTALATPAHSSFGHDDDEDNNADSGRGDDYYDAPMSVNPFTPGGFSSYDNAD